LQRKVIGLSGEIAAGKTIIANYLNTKGYRDIRYSKVLESMLVSEGKDVSRSALQEIGKCVIRSHPPPCGLAYDTPTQAL
jgi:dephospho-CoA kinase